jgi:hypothetical protein
MSIICAGIMCAPARSQIIEDNASKQTSYGCILKKKTSVAAINITLGVPGQRADKIGGKRHCGDAEFSYVPHLKNL